MITILIQPHLLLAVDTDELVSIRRCCLPVTDDTDLRLLLQLLLDVHLAPLQLLGLCLDPLLCQERVQHPCSPQAGDPAARTGGEGGRVGGGHVARARVETRH